MFHDPRTAGTTRVAARPLVGVAIVLVVVHGATIAVSSRPAGATVGAESVRLRVDPNVASREELMLLPRIGPVLADYIIEFRESNRVRPAFRSAEDLQNVKRIGPVTVEGLRPFLVFIDTDRGPFDREVP